MWEYRFCTISMGDQSVAFVLAHVQVCARLCLEDSFSELSSWTRVNMWGVKNGEQFQSFSSLYFSKNKNEKQRVIIMKVLRKIIEYSLSYFF